MAEKYEIYQSEVGFQVRVVGGEFDRFYVAMFWHEKGGLRCPNAEREARNLCRRLNAAAKKGKVKR